MKNFFSKYVKPTFGHAFGIGFGLGCGVVVGGVSGAVILFAMLAYG
jgi:hypothetical protein